jgi:hypothetical protein
MQQQSNKNTLALLPKVNKKAIYFYLLHNVVCTYPQPLFSGFVGGTAWRASVSHAPYTQLQQCKHYSKNDGLICFEKKGNQ